MKKNFKEWLYWDATFWIVWFYLIAVPAFAIFQLTTLTHISLAFLFVWYCWMKDFEKKMKKRVDKSQPL